MKKLIVEVCVCTECVMKSAMDIIDSIESLKKLKVQLRFDTQIEVKMCKCLGDAKHGDLSPMVRINNEVLERANSETVMARVIGLVSREQRQIV